jgi:hypothetical protein
MITRKTNLLMTASTAALVALGGAAFAQTATTDTDTNVQATDVQGGQVVVEQKDATVDVTVPDPEVDVTQRAPVVTVEQPQPEITVTVPEPTVRVEQQAPIITVEQAQPQVTVRIPEPVVTVQVPQPEVDVATGEPIVDLEQPEPVVRFLRPEPKITVEESEPRIRVTNAEPTVNVDETEQARVDVNQSEAEVNIQQGEDADVQVSSAQPTVRVEDGEEADVNVQQAEAVVRIEDFNADEMGNIEDEQDRERYREAAMANPLFERTAGEFLGRNVITEEGEDVGEIDFIGVRGDTLVAIVGVGGFLGMGENDVAIPVNQMVLEDDVIVLPRISEDRLEDMPEYDDRMVRQLDPNLRLSDGIRFD